MAEQTEMQAYPAHNSTASDPKDRHSEPVEFTMTAQDEPMTSTLFNPKRWPLYKLRSEFREYMGEFWGIFFLMFLGDSSGAMLKFHAGPNWDLQTNATYLAVTIAWGFALTAGLYVSMGVSGGHLNPAVTLANAVFGAFPWRKVPGYMVAQMLGSMTGVACMYGLFKQHFDEWEVTLAPGTTMTQSLGGLFCTYPNMKNKYAVWSEIINTAVLMMGIFGINDERMTPARGYKPIAVGLIVWMIGLTSGYNTAFALNPARDLGARFISAFLWGKEPFTRNGHYFVIPLFVPFLGALVGTFIYTFFIVPYEKDEEGGKKYD